MGAMNRRQALRLSVLGLALLGTSTGVGQLATAQPAPTAPGDEFTELYKGRRLRGILVRLGPRLTPRVFVDGVELHLMRLGTGGYTTQMNHYQTYGTPRLAARAAVDSLNGATLLPLHR